MADHSAGQTIGRAALARIRRRLLPFTFLLYIVAYLDRINVGFAALEMNRQLGLGDAAYGLGAGLFFIGYFLFEIPSNLILHRVGARAWIARIMISWGMVAIAMAAVRGAASFYLLRFLLGVAEAGFFPGIILYLTYWFPAREQARSIALFMTASALAGVIGGPLSGALLAMDGALGLSGWQWLFVLEGAPSVILGLTVLLYLPNGPGDARWLTAAEKRWLAERLEFERSSGKEGGLVRTLTNGRVWMLSMLYFAIVTGLYGVTLWLPQIIKGFGALGNFEVGVISAVPFLFAAACDGSNRPLLGPARRAAMARRVAGVCGDRRFDDLGAYPRPRGCAGRAVVGRRRHLGGDGSVLVDAAGVLKRRRSGSRHRADQLGGQPGRLRRPVPGRAGPAEVAQLQRRPRRDGRNAGAGRMPGARCLREQIRIG